MQDPKYFCFGIAINKLLEQHGCHLSETVMLRIVLTSAFHHATVNLSHCALVVNHKYFQCTSHRKRILAIRRSDMRISLFGQRLVQRRSKLDVEIDNTQQ